MKIAERLICEGQADLISIGRYALANPDWPARLRSRDPFKRFDPHMRHPSATLEHADGWRAQLDVSQDATEGFGSPTSDVP